MKSDADKNFSVFIYDDSQYPVNDIPREFPGNSIFFFSPVNPIIFTTEITPAILLVPLLGIKPDVYASRNWLRPFSPHGNT